MSVRHFLLLCVIFCCACPTLFGETIYFPQVADGAGWSTTFTLINTNTAAVSGTVRLYNQNGSPRVLALNGVANSQFAVSIPAGGSVRLVVET
jgi:hypothetical protein